MPDVKVDYEAPDLAGQIEQLSQHDLDNLPFGVVRLDGAGVVQFYSATEARLSGYGESPLGQNFFDVSRCAGKGDLRARITEALERGRVDLEFAFPGDYGDPTRELRMRVQSAKQGGVWLFVQRD
jgi:photoactive yellow protein